MPVMHELVSNLTYEVGLAPLVVADNTAQTTAIVDMLGVEHVAFVALTGTLADTDATFAWSLTHGEVANLSDGAAVDAACLVDPLATADFTFAADSTTKVVGYTPGKGNGKRYVRATITPANNTGSAPLAILVIKMPTQRPVA